ncbi:hypothetical protein [Hymenobacter volaticus]|uniref:Uncharacterized protein n=1 Tax=Hymenobacter volaticus TaxID=2932254 RepID=A0ABY4G5P6_9BACT|nr:hypothetical protein [Hymenobacter volaticus]UOQ66138.1 hypothetical protein MUN86_22020 [Hymenobacter volaticus]
MYARLAVLWLLLGVLFGGMGSAQAQTSPPLNLNAPPQLTPPHPIPAGYDYRCLIRGGWQLPRLRLLQRPYQANHCLFGGHAYWC